jgi:vancomycin resistance protein YoaR
MFRSNAIMQNWDRPHYACNADPAGLDNGTDQIRKADSRRTATSYCVAVGLPLFLGATYWLNRPFADVVAEQPVYLGQLSTVQKANIALAAHKLDGVMVKPGKTFSFNAVIGPRTVERGFRAAPSYVRAGTADTLGGGICLLSSSLYKVALETGMKIVARTPHMKTIKTVKPGLDATVWYSDTGQKDLIFKNTSESPIQFHTTCDNSVVNVQMLGTDNDIWHCTVDTIEKESTAKSVHVQVVRHWGDRDEFISDDSYGRNN